jgi:hypothetical protein
MLCQIATDPDLSLKGLSKYRLFDFFVHFLLDREVKKRGRDAAFSLDVRRQFNRALAFWLWSQGGISTVSLASIPAEICRGAAKGISHEYDDEALRKELTAGCLIEKGATGTIYFGHRSLQEFLVAEHLIETDLERASIEDKKEALDALGLITPEVGSFIVEATQSSKATRNTVLKWFGVLKNLRRKDMPRLGMRFFMDLYSLFPDTVAGRANDPWFIWLKYFTANGAVEFAPKAGAAVGQLSALLQFLDGTKDQQTATLILFAEALSRPSDIRTRSAEQFIAKWLNPNMLRDALSTARGIKSGDHHYVSMEQNFLLWTFLYAAKEIGSVPPRVVVDLRELRRRAGAALVMGFADEQDENLPEETRFLNVSAQGIYRAWGIREADLEKLRPFFTDPGLRSKIRPLEIVRTGRQGGDQAVTFVKAAARQPLTLKKRGGPNARGQ